MEEIARLDTFLVNKVPSTRMINRESFRVGMARL